MESFYRRQEKQLKEKLSIAFAEVAEMEERREKIRAYAAEWKRQHGQE